MFDDSTLPQSVRTEFERLSGDGEDTTIVAATDILLDGATGEEWLVAGRKRACVLAPNGDAAEVRHDIEVQKIGSVKADVLVGSGFLEISSNGATVQALRFSTAASRKFQRVAKLLEDLAKEGEVKLDTEEEDKLRCKNCRRMLPKDSTVCPRCLNKGKVFRRLVGYAKPYWVRAAGMAVLMFAGTGLRFVPPIVTKMLVDDVLVPKTQYPGIETAPLVKLLGWMVAMLVFTAVVGTLMSTARGRLSAYIGSKMVFDVRALAYDNLQRLSLSYYDKQQVGGLMSRVGNDTEIVHGFIVDGIHFFVVNVVLLVGIGAVMFWYNWKLAIWALVPTPIMVYAVHRLIKVLIEMFHRYYERRSRFMAVVNDALSGVRVVKAFAQEDREAQRYGEKNYEFYKAAYDAERTWATFIPAFSLLMTSGSFVIWYVGGWQVLSDQITLGMLTLFLTLLGMFYGPVEALSQLNQWLSRCLTAAQRVFEVVDAEPDVKDVENPVDPNEIEGSFEFCDVTFGYDRYKPVLKGVSLKVEPGEMIGLVGHSGAGKTTMVNLVSRFYDVNEGCIKVDGVDLREIKRHEYGAQLGIVLQESFLFSGTIAENIAYGKPDATRDEIMAAARAANAHGFVLRKPDGYDTQVGERGARLSVGEKQRISIARAILRDPRVLILDEATASVDTETEKAIQEALARLVKGRTTFAIAHRLSTLRNASRLVVLDKGEIKEVGTHDELMQKKDGVYRKLVEMQTEMSRMKAVDG